MGLVYARLGVVESRVKRRREGSGD
jgi:hypothetical protein